MGMDRLRSVEGALSCLLAATTFILEGCGSNQPAPTPTPTPTPTVVARSARETPQDPISSYVERVRTYWLPQAEALPDVPPETDPTFGRLLTVIDELGGYIEDGSLLPLTAKQRESRSRLIAVLRKKQTKLLPGMRRRYAKDLDAKLFRDDVRVSLQGTTLTLTGSAFVRNANVEDMQAELRPVATRLRFRRVAYRWSQILGGSLFYDLNVPSDSTVGRWTGEYFVKLDAEQSMPANPGKRDPACVPSLAASIGLKC